MRINIDYHETTTALSHTCRNIIITLSVAWTSSFVSCSCNRSTIFFLRSYSLQQTGPLMRTHRDTQLLYMLRMW